ncbi:MAG TPA: hypothetical protein VGF75_06865 [Candidatus Saccharimonadales bacterium]|jgi:hypothetical protein
MPAISASGQVYVLNGALSVQSVGGQYLATGSPLSFIGGFAAPVGVTTKTYTIPSGARSIIIDSPQSLNKVALNIYGTTTLLEALFVSSNGSGPLAAQLPDAGDLTVTVTVTNNSGTTQDMYLYWGFSLDDYGTTSLVAANSYRPPYGIGKYSMITNARTPVKFGDDSQDPQRATATSVTQNGSGVLVAAPGAGYSLVVWQSSVYCVGTAQCDALITDSAGNVLNRCDTLSIAFSNVVHGGIRLPTNTGISWYSDNFITQSVFTVWFTSEIT